MKVKGVKVEIQNGDDFERKDTTYNAETDTWDCTVEEARYVPEEEFLIAACAWDEAGNYSDYIGWSHPIIDPLARVEIVLSEDEQATDVSFVQSTFEVVFECIAGPSGIDPDSICVISAPGSDPVEVYELEKTETETGYLCVAQVFGQGNLELICSCKSNTGTLGELASRKYYVDVNCPRIEEITIVPDVITVGQPYTIKVRASDLPY